MEKRKLLLVTISVGIFLVISIGAAILVFGPKNTNPGPVAGYHSNPGQPAGAAPQSSLPYPPAGQNGGGSVQGGNGQDRYGQGSYGQGSYPPATVDAVDLVRSPGEAPGLKTLPDGGIQPGAEYYVNGSSYSGGNAETVISVPKPSTAAVPDTPPAAPARAAPAQAAPKAAAPAAPKPAAAKPAAPPKVYDDYWVQTGAFSTVASAEHVKETLASKGITSIIENRDVEGSTLFRVRVGPYTSKNEADYWLSLIKTIGGFENSQVRQTQSRR